MRGKTELLHLTRGLLPFRTHTRHTRVSQSLLNNNSLHWFLPPSAHSHLGIAQHHDVDLGAVQVVAVVADDARQFDFADLVQLFRTEGARPAAVLVPEAVALRSEETFSTDGACIASGPYKSHSTDGVGTGRVN